MRVSILLQITGDDGTIGPAEEMTAFEKTTERSEDLGLSIAEGKAMLAAVQARTVLAQAATWSQQRRCCPACGERRRSKGSYPLVFRTLYGDVELTSPRLHRCPCQPADGPATVSPFRDLLPVPYFHVVFTMPEPIAAIALQNKRVVYDILFRSTAASLRTIAADPRHLGAEIGFVAVLHT